MIILLILITSSHDNVWKSSGENCCWSLLGLKGLITRWRDLILQPECRHLELVPASIFGSLHRLPIRHSPQAFDELLDSPQKCLLFYCETKGELNKRSRFIYSILWCTTLLALEEAYYRAPEYHPAKTGTQLEMVKQPPIWDKHFWYFSKLCPFY